MNKDELVATLQAIATEHGVDFGQLVKGTLDECKEHDLPIHDGVKLALDHLTKVDPEYYTTLESAGL